MRVLAVPSGIGVAHVQRCLLVARRLAERGHHVTFATSPVRHPLVAEHGYDVVPVHDVVVDPHDDVYAAWSDDDAEQALSELEGLAAELRPDVVLADFHPLATIAAEAAGVPSAALVTAAFTPGAVGLTGVGATGFTRRVASRLLDARGAHVVRTFATAAARRSQHDRDTLAGVFRGDTTLVTELASFTGPLGDGVTWTGPLVWEDDGPVPPPPPPGTARIYVTAGNTGDPDLLTLAVDALAGRPGFELVLTSGQLSPVPEVAEGVVAAATLPGSQVLAHARLAIHPGGVGTTYQVLAAGVPMLVVPAVSGQEITARLVERQRVGLGFRLDRLPPERLRAAAAQVVLDEGYRRRAQAFAAELAAIDGPAAAADQVEALVRAGGGGAAGRGPG
jgi:UDP:flavonoid glycosyltransferase YjiC (YdhE family)